MCCYIIQDIGSNVTCKSNIANEASKWKISIVIIIMQVVGNVFFSISQWEQGCWLSHLRCLMYFGYGNSKYPMVDLHPNV